MIHCIGDSHISFFSGEDAIQPVWPAASRDRLPLFKTHHIGAALAYNLTREGTRTQGREKLFEVISSEVPDGATILLSFGEIDCRMHLTKQAEKTNIPISDIVYACLEEYFRTVAEITALGYRVIVYNAVLSRPRVRGSRRFSDAEYATHGTIVERSETLRIFNSGAKERCAKAGVYFLENTPHLVDRSGTIPAWYFFDSIHLSQRAMPVTLRELAALIPSLGVEVPPLCPPTLSRRFADWIARRRKRLLKEFGKVWK
jgi:hypothetical protein